ncbi:PREDICTED: B3 domain-containing transcription factor LEC2 isoform X1 [Camelina sativa]|uniref:B3 domain-containing transcription factor LEC2 isoform X1 n=1 Tax=Camelina sativa TaxID=90675 RepID=A0ABM0VSV3_CAMSA|nr:PREDICTED: B3 domain-containing transcription factor LEC2 isoform X1 [Camelina sativa]
MDNFFPFSSSNANSVQEFAMDANNNLSHLTTMPTYDHHQAEPHHLLYSYPVEQMAAVMNPHQPLYSSDAYPQIPVSQTGSEFCSLVSNPNPCLRPERGGLFLDPTKMARINRKNAMIRSRNNSSPNSSPDEVVDSKRQVMMLNMKNNVQIPERKDHYPHSTFDNKKLRVLCVKLLKNSDVGALGRIVLPKREAEGKLPKLSDKEGIVLEMRDVFSLQSWSFKYKFWSNNKSRMYVLENTGEFVRQNGVESGDTLTIYEDESKNLYFAVTKPGRQNGGRGVESMKVNEMNHYEEIMYDFMPGDEEEASIAMLIGNLNDHYPNPNDLMGLTIDHQHHQAASSLPSVDYAHVGSLDDQVSFDDIGW